MRGAGGRRSTLGVLAVLVIGLSGCGLFQSSADSSGPGGSADEDLLTVVAEISTFVEEERGLSFKEPATVTVLDETAFTERVFEDFDEDEEQIRTNERVLKALGLLAPDVDLVADLRRFAAVGVLGFYDPETGELVVRGSELTPGLKSTIAHELVHALDDQWFELHRPEYDDRDDEIGFGFSAVVEGNAERISEQYVSSLSPEERAAAQREELEAAGSIDLGSFPPFLIQSVIAPYVLGPTLVEVVMSVDGQDGLDAAFENPPLTSEQVMWPDRYLADDQPIVVAAPSADGEIVDEGAFGALALQLMLAEIIGFDPARQAAEGWGGDWYVAWEDGETTCVRAEFVGDTATDTSEIADALTQWEIFRPDATVNGATLTSCA